MAAGAIKGLPVVQFLLEAGAEINAQSNGGETPLMKAVFLIRVDTVQFLVEAGADKELMNISGRNAFDYAITTKHPAILSLF